jgi:superfamily II DNA or RNA helicase
MQTELNLNDQKDREQRSHLNAWAENNYKGTSIAATGLGKTRMGVLAIAHSIKTTGKALIIVPTENLRDNEWQNEFEKWGYSNLLPRVEFMCIQSAYKLEKNHWDIVVVDEVHTTLSHEYRKFYSNNTWDKIYCLTATPPENDAHLELLVSFAPIVRKTDLKKANNLGLIADHKVYNIGISFTPMEALEYNRINTIYNQAVDNLGGALVAFKNASKWKTSRDSSKSKWANIFYMAMQKRKNLCYNAAGKISLAKDILETFPTRKALVFSESIQFAERLQEILGDECITFHSKLSKKARVLALEEFADDTNSKRVISSVKALNAGFNVPDCSLGICTAGSSKALDNIQRKGRTLRVQENKNSIYVNLYVKGSQEVKWVRKRTSKDHNVKWINNVNQIII